MAWFHGGLCKGGHGSVGRAGTRLLGCASEELRAMVCAGLSAAEGGGWLSCCHGRLGLDEREEGHDELRRRLGGGQRNKEMICRSEGR